MITDEQVDYVPCILARDEGRILELVLRDVPSYVGKTVSARLIRDMETREIIGLQWSASPSIDYLEAAPKDEGGER